MSFWVKQHQDGRAVSQPAATASAAFTLADDWAKAWRLPVRVDTKTKSYPLHEFKAALDAGEFDVA
jgi:hypothetical protein